MRRFVALCAFALLALAVWPQAPANHYIRAGANGNGSDWTNACGGFTGSCAPASLLRGDTYYVAGGNYAGVVFNKAASGTAPIIIKGATATDHGTDTGWQASYGVDATQAKFTGKMTFNTSYWVFDGSVGPTWDRNPAHYGFRFVDGLNSAIGIFNTSMAIGNITVAHIAAISQDASHDVEKIFLPTDNATKSVSNITMSHLFLKWFNNAYWATSPGLTMDNWVFEYCMCTEGMSTPAHHGEWINNNYGYMTNQVTRFSWFENTSDQTGIIVANNNDNVNAQVYGNVFYNLNVANGVVTGTSAGNLVSPKVFNNTFVKAGSSGGWMGDHVTGTPIVQNNLLYNMSASKQVSGTDYNSYFKTTNTPSETHGQVSTADPFVNSTGTNFHLSIETANGITVGAPLNVDVDGNARPGVDGVWSRGAFQYGGAPPPPQPVTISISPTPTTLLVSSTQQFTADLQNTSNTAVNWAAAGAGTITPAGLFTASAMPGAATVAATSQADTTKVVTLNMQIVDAPPPSTTSTFGNTTIGTVTDTGDSNAPMTSRYTSGVVGGSAVSISVYVATPLSTSPNNQFQVALYSDSNGNPGTLIAKSTSGTLAGNAWNSRPIVANIAPNTPYWLAYNTNGTSTAVNNIRMSSGGKGCWKVNTAMGTWPASFGASGCSTVSIAAYLTYSTVAPAVSVVVSPKAATLQVNATQKFTATVNNTTKTGVTWSASCGAIDADGLFTALESGTCVVTATSIADIEKYDTATVTVTPPPPTLTLDCNAAKAAFTATNMASGTILTIRGEAAGVMASCTTTLP